MPPSVEVLDGHEATVGRITVRRVLPRRRLRTVGAWCFADHMGPVEVTETSGLDVGPHPHTGLQTVTWLTDGAVLHRDSLGSEQLIRPGQLNLMTAGRGVVHAEEGTGTYRGTLQGIQLWVAQPESERFGDPDFKHIAQLPQVEFGQAMATVLAGSFLDVQSPAPFGKDLVGLDAIIQRGTTIFPLRADYEYAVVALDGALEVGESTSKPGQIASLGVGRDEVAISASAPTRMILLGGVPFPEPVFMWWNFVGRNVDEIGTFYRDWRDKGERFGEVNSTLERIPAPPPPWEPIRSTTAS